MIWMRKRERQSKDKSVESVRSWHVVYIWWQYWIFPDEIFWGSVVRFDSSSEFNPVVHVKIQASLRGSFPRKSCQISTDTVRAQSVACFWVTVFVCLYRVLYIALHACVSACIFFYVCVYVCMSVSRKINTCVIDYPSLHVSLKIHAFFYVFKRWVCLHVYVSVRLLMHLHATKIMFVHVKSQINERAQVCMCMFMGICIRMCMWRTCMCMCACTCMFMCIRMCMWMRMCMCMCICVYVYITVTVSVSMFSCMCVCVRTLIDSCTYQFVSESHCSYTRVWMCVIVFVISCWWTKIHDQTSPCLRRVADHPICPYWLSRRRSVEDADFALKQIRWRLINIMSKIHVSYMLKQTLIVCVSLHDLTRYVHARVSPDCVSVSVSFRDKRAKIINW